MQKIPPVTALLHVFIQQLNYFNLSTSSSPSTQVEYLNNLKVHEHEEKLLAAPINFQIKSEITQNGQNLECWLDKGTLYQEFYSKSMKF